MTNSLLDSLAKERLVWLPDIGVGYYPVTAQPYDGSYWDKYRNLDRTPTGEKLTAARVALVRKYLKPKQDQQRVVVDVGIGGGRFVEEMDCCGMDVNPAAVEWLYNHNKLVDPALIPVAALTFWDSLEHIHEPSGLLDNAREWVFVSCPIFDNIGHIKRSKHFKPEEHCWYFTRGGIEEFMQAHGFGLVEANRMEEEAGREDIGTFVFKRIA